MLTILLATIGRRTSSPADNDLDAALVDAKAAHLFLPVDERSEAIFVVHVVDHDDTVGVLVELLTYKAVVIIA